MKENYRIDKEKKEVIVTYEINNLLLTEAADIVINSREAARSFVNYLFWCALELANGYNEKQMENEYMPIVFDYKSQLWIIEIRFFAEMFGKYLDEKFGTKFAKEFYDLADRCTREDLDSADVLHIIVSLFETKFGIIKQNTYDYFKNVGNAKSVKLKIRPKYFNRKMMQKIDKDGEILEYEIDMVGIINRFVDGSFDVDLLDDLRQMQFKSNLKVLEKSVYEYRKEMETSLEICKKYYYNFGNYDKYALK